MQHTKLVPGTAVAVGCYNYCLFILTILPLNCTYAGVYFKAIGIGPRLNYCNALSYLHTTGILILPAGVWPLLLFIVHWGGGVIIK